RRRSWVTGFLAHDTAQGAKRLRLPFAMKPTSGFTPDFRTENRRWPREDAKYPASRRGVAFAEGQTSADAFSAALGPLANLGCRGTDGSAKTHLAQHGLKKLSAVSRRRVPNMLRSWR